MARQTTKRWWQLAVFVAPAFVLYSLFLIYPLLGSLAGSLYRWDGLNSVGFAGLSNFARLFAPPFVQRVIQAFTHNVWWFVGIMVIQNGLGLLFAYILYQELRGMKFFRAAFFLPATLSPIVVGALWRLMLHPTGGVVNKLLKLAGLGKYAVPWLGLPQTALPVLILVDAWNWVGFPMMVFLAAMNDIPPEIMEASRLDGANRWQQIRLVMAPLIWPSITTISVLTFINTFNTFDLVYIMEGLQGNPFYATDVLGIAFYRLAFGSQGGSGVTDTGLALALGALMLFIVGAGTILALRWMQRRKVEY